MTPARPEAATSRSGRTWNAVRLCSRCMRNFPHPLAAGWRIDATEAGARINVCPACATPDDLRPDGSSGP